jgi:hypothetical protein
LSRKPFNQIFRGRQISHVAKADQHHICRCAPVWGRLDFLHTFDQHLPRPHQNRDGQFFSHIHAAHAFRLRQISRVPQAGDCPKTRDRVHQFQHITQHQAGVSPTCMGSISQGKGLIGFAGKRGV